MNAPTVNDQIFAIDENSVIDLSVGTVFAIDPDIGDILTFAIIVGDPTGAFSIDPATGEITVADATQLDFETTPSFALTIEVSDSFGLTDTATITIDLNDINDAPTTSDITVATAEDTAYTFTVADFGFTDVDAGDSFAKFRITGLPSAESLELSGIAVTLGQDISAADITAGNLAFVPDPDANGAGYASFQFEVNDGTAYSAPATLTIDVTPVNDAPVAVDDGGTTDEDRCGSSGKDSPAHTMRRPLLSQECRLVGVSNDPRAAVSKPINIVGEVLATATCSNSKSGTAAVISLLSKSNLSYRVATNSSNLGSNGCYEVAASDHP